MNIQDALQVFGLSGQDIELATIKTQYRALCSKYHPDRNPAGLQMMQAVNAAYAALQNAHENDWSVSSKADNNASYGDDLNDAINAILDLAGLDIEICGSWVWVSGDTKTHKDTLKTAGYKYAAKKQRWYFRPDNYKSRGRGKFTMDEIRDYHGSQSVHSKPKTALHAR